MARSSIVTPLLLAALAASLASASAGPLDLELYRAASEAKWEESIAEFEALDASESHPAGSILFVGSSSIRKWDDIAADLAPYHPIQRGFGGSRWSDVAVFAERIVAPHRYRAAVFFVGNDISGKEDDKSPAEVAALFEYVLEKVRAHNPESAVFYVAVTPTPSRWEAWPRIRKANSAARAACRRHENTWFVGTESIFLDAEGKPRPELFLGDKLHLNRDGYTLWAAAIKSHLDTVLNGAR